ncbi:MULTISPECIES: hypothetical protein [Pseudomonas]|nr:MULTISPECIES: hypothetical protein [Pseudomonas]
MIIGIWSMLALQSLILIMLSFQYLQHTKTSRLLNHWRISLQEHRQRAYWHIEENRELRSALRAEKAHIEQLQRQVEILKALLPVV